MPKPIDKINFCIICGMDVLESQLVDNICFQCECEHDTAEYQPEEKDTNTPESYTCDECGSDLPIPTPDYDAMVKEDSLV